MTTQDHAAVLVTALQRIAKWEGEFPATGQQWPNGAPLPYAKVNGLHGERDYMRGVAQAALDAFTAPPPQQPAQGWISLADRMPERGRLVVVYSPPGPHDWPDTMNIAFDALDPDSDGDYWIQHDEHYEHYCSVALPEGSTGPSADAPYTHWMPIPAAPAMTAQGQVQGDGNAG